MKPIIYKNKPISSINSLANKLKISVKELTKIANKSQDFYFPNKPKIKENGDIRQTYRVGIPLKRVQQKVLQEIISDVQFPIFLQGSIKDTENKRDYIHNANLHVGREAILKEDIANFFPTIQTDAVYKIWKYFFNFPHDVAKTITNLTTYNGAVPQGAPTSSAIANLVFWEFEPALEYKFRKKGYVYSRYVDDITVSFTTKINKKEFQDITTQIYGMFIHAGVKPNRAKRAIQVKSSRMEVHNLNTNSGKLTLPASERLKIRAALKQLELLAQSASSWEEIKKSYNSVRGRVNTMERLHPHQAKKYIDRLDSIKKSF